MAYTIYSDLIDCKVNDKAYVYERSLGFEYIDKNMIGTVVHLEQSKYEEPLGQEYLSYNAIIKMPNGKLIKITDNAAQPHHREYEFITLKDLREICNIENA